MKKLLFQYIGKCIEYPTLSVCLSVVVSARVSTGFVQTRTTLKMDRSLWRTLPLYEIRWFINGSKSTAFRWITFIEPFQLNKIYFVRTYYKNWFFSLNWTNVCAIINSIIHSQKNERCFKKCSDNRTCLTYLFQFFIFSSFGKDFTYFFILYHWSKFYFNPHIYQTLINPPSKTCLI